MIIGRRVRGLERWLELAAVSALLVVCTTSRASATDTCVVGKSTDGYVALRAEPSPRGSLRARAREGEAVVIEKRDNGDLIERGSWLRVFYFPGTVIPPKSDPSYRKGRSGWMHRRYVVDCG